MDSKIYNIIVAAGNGSRFGAGCPKQYCLLDGKPILMHTIQRMRHALPQSEIILVISAAHTMLWEELCQTHNFQSPQIVIGGKTRWESVKNAIDIISSTPDSNSIITIHDGARPLIDDDLIHRIINGVKGHSGAIPAIAVTDSLRMLTDSGNSIAVDRSMFRAIQTPQAFDADKLIEAYRLDYNDAFTDDASVMTAAGYDDIILVEGSNANIKITHPADIETALFYMTQKG